MSTGYIAEGVLASNVHVEGNITTAGNVTLTDPTTGFDVTLKATPSTTESYQICLPTAAPSENGQSLTATTGGVASWTTVAGGGSLAPKTYYAADVGGGHTDFIVALASDWEINVAATPGAAEQSNMLHSYEFKSGADNAVGI